MAGAAVRFHFERRRGGVDSVMDFRDPRQSLEMQPEGVRLRGPREPRRSAKSSRPSSTSFGTAFAASAFRSVILEDEALEVFLRVQGALAEYDPTRSIRPCDCRIRLSRCLRISAPPAPPLRTDGLQLHGRDVRVPEQSAAEGEERASVTAALDRVEVDRRAVLVLHDVYGYTIPEVAANCDIPLNTAYSRLRLARAEFAQALRRLGWRNES